MQTGQHYSPLRAGLTAVAFSVGSFALAPQAAPLARRFGRLVLALGGLLFAAGIIGVVAGAHHVGTGTNPWPLVPGLVVAGAGLSLLVIPLVNVVLAAVPAEAAAGRPACSARRSSSAGRSGSRWRARSSSVTWAALVPGRVRAHRPVRGRGLLICAVLSLTLPRDRGGADLQRAIGPRPRGPVALSTTRRTTTRTAPGRSGSGSRPSYFHDSWVSKRRPTSGVIDTRPRSST